MFNSMRICASLVGAVVAMAGITVARAEALFDDDKVRVQELRFRPGDEGPNVRRPFRVIRVLEGGTMQRIHPDGSAEEIQYRAGEVKVFEADGPFALRNIGTSDIVLHVVALKDPAWTSIREAGWTPLIEGAAGLENWNRVGDANWRSEDGAIVADQGAGGYLVSKRSFTDFYLKAEFWAEHSTNSGVFIRLSDPLRVTSKNAYEVNIFDASPEPSRGTGAIVGIAAAAATPKVGGRWSVCEITARGRRVVVRINGIQTVEALHDRFAQGPLALQFRSGPIKWRKVQIREL